MDKQILRFRITDLAASVPEGVPLMWQGREYDSGPLVIRLDKSAPGPVNQGELDYSRRYAQAEFHVRLEFPELASLLEALGVDSELTQPVRAVLHSEGEILEDHSFVLSGRCDLGPHALLPAEETIARVLPGR